MYSLLCLLPTGQLRQALGETLHAHELDPLTRTTRAILAETLYYNRDYARAIAESADLRSQPAGPSPGDRAYFLSLSLSGQGRRALSEARLSMGAAPENSPGAALLGYLEARHGDRARAQAILERLLRKSKSSYTTPLAAALLAAGLSDEETTLAQLRLAVETHIPMACQIGVDPVFDPLHDDTRFKELVRQMKLKPQD